MKKILLFSIFSLMTFFSQESSAQVIHIELNLMNHMNDSNNITGCIMEPTSPNYKMYVHSGVCSSTTAGVPDPVDCQNPAYVWEHVVGDWGQDNGHGEMTKLADSLWAIDIDVSTYYSNAATISQTGQGSAGASTPMPQGATAYSMGFVFRNEDGTIGGITGGCTDFFIFNLHQGNTTVDVGQAGFSLPDSTFGVTANTTATNEVLNVSFKTVFPNPFNDHIKLTYNTQIEQDDVEFSVYNQLGQKVKQIYRGPVQAGVSTLDWDAKNEAGSLISAGVYYLVITDGQNRQTEIIVKH
jgi:molybdopterin-binding protein